METVFLNGQYLPKATATISVMDRGFLFGDGVYEVIPVYAGVTFTANEHMARLERSMQAIDLHCEYSLEKLHNIANLLIEKNHVSDCLLYFQITRGRDQSRSHVYPDASVKPTVFAYCMPYTRHSKQYLEQGHHAITAEDPRWNLCQIKSINLLPNIMLAEHAKKNQAIETILIRDGYVIEGTSSNVFIVENGRLITAPTQPGMLSGITRAKIIELAKKHQMPLSEENYTEGRLRAADEIWLTSSSKPIMPITLLDNEPVGNGKTGDVWRTMMQRFDALIKSH